jgi:hypothetical protein
MKTPWEAVHIWDDSWDGWRAGFADYGGRLHYYRSLSLDKDQSKTGEDRWNAGDDRFELTPMSEFVLRWAQECAAIRGRFVRATHQAGNASAVPDDERVLPPDRARRDELKQRIAAELAANSNRSFVVRGKFGPGWQRVRWRPVDESSRA